MGETNADDPIIMSPPLGGRIGSVFATTLIGALGLFMLAMTVLLIAGGYLGLSMIFAALTVVMGILFRYILRDTGGNRYIAKIYIGARRGVCPRCITKQAEIVG